MEIQEQQFVRELAESRMQIELLRNRVLLRYYAQLLELDIMEQTQEVKALMSSIILSLGTGKASLTLTTRLIN